MKRHIISLIFALPLLLGAYTASAQVEYSIVKPTEDAEKWDVSHNTATEGTSVTIKYTGNKYVKDVTLKPLITSVSINPSCLSMLVGETFDLKVTVLSEIAEVDKTVTWSSDDATENVLSVDATGKVTANAVGSATITATARGKTASLTIYVKEEPDNCIPGVFSVSATKKVKFSKGNLQYNVNDKTWRFAEHQWDYVGGTVDGVHIGNTSGSTNNNASGPWIDLFGWGTWLEGGNSTNTSDDYRDYQWDADKYSAICAEWQTLSFDEWNYLLFERKIYNNIRFSKVTVHGVKGLVLMPDNWDGTSNSSIPSEAFAAISDDNWSTLESKGAVFLPAAGERYVEFVYSVGSQGKYWSSKAYSGFYSYYVNFDSEYVTTTGLNRARGFSVRLVRGL